MIEEIPPDLGFPSIRVLHPSSTRALTAALIWTIGAYANDYSSSSRRQISNRNFSLLSHKDEYLQIEMEQISPCPSCSIGTDHIITLLMSKDSANISCNLEGTRTGTRLSSLSRAKEKLDKPWRSEHGLIKDKSRVKYVKWTKNTR